MVFFRPYLEQLSSLQPLGDDLVAHVGLKHLLLEAPASSVLQVLIAGGVPWSGGRAKQTRPLLSRQKTNIFKGINQVSLAAKGIKLPS